MNWKLIAAIALIAYGGYQQFSKRAVSYGPGVVAALAPEQQKSNQKPFTHNGFSITPLESFEIEARVLSREDYSTGREADLAQTDLALGWGKMSDESILKDIKITQSGRFYFWHVDEFKIPREEIETHSANMHMIPADTHIEKILKTIRKGHIVKISGDLIEAKASDGWHWKSSLTRTDTGNGACEVVFVKALTVR